MGKAWIAIGVVLVQRRGELFAQQRLSAALDTLATFFKHHVAFGPNHLLTKHQAAHAVGFEIHHVRQCLGGHGFEIGGDIGRGEGVQIAAEFGDGGIQFASGVAFGALEHQMLKEMGDAGLACWLVGTTHLVPDHMGDHWCPMIGDHHDLQPVVEAKMGDGVLGRCRRLCGRLLREG